MNFLNLEFTFKYAKTKYISDVGLYGNIIQKGVQIFAEKPAWALVKRALSNGLRKTC